MEKETNGFRTRGEELISEKYSKMFGRPMQYTIVVTRYKEGPNGERKMIWDENPNFIKTPRNE